MKILFLDIDGVCNSLNFARTRQMNLVNAIDPAAAKLVKQIVAETGCKIVISSTWRAYPDAMEVVRREIGEILDVTPSMEPHARGYEVEAWLEKHPEVVRHAILDDDVDFSDDQPLFKTSFNVGLTPKIAKRVIKYLNVEGQNEKNNINT